MGRKFQYGYKYMNIHSYILPPSQMIYIYIAEYFQYTLETADDITQYYFALRDRWYGTFYSLKDVICTTRGESGI